MGSDYLFSLRSSRIRISETRGKASRIQAKRAEKTKDIEAYLNAVTEYKPYEN